MSWDAEQFTKKVAETTQCFDEIGTSTLCNELIGYLRDTDCSYPVREAQRVLKLLRDKRFFSLMQKVASAFIQSGQKALQICRQYVQAMIEQGDFVAALQQLEVLVPAAASDPTELAEARGLTGRVYKQQYVNAKGAPTERNRKNLEQAVRAYADAYQEDPQHPLWHGINTVALLRRAERDGVQLSGVRDAETIAKDILSNIESRDLNGTTSAWDFATALEACVALNRREEAQQWTVRYAQDPSANAFEVASTLRQLTEVWQLSPETELGKALLPILQAGLLKREGGHLDISPQDIHRTLSESDTLKATLEHSPHKAKFEKNFGDAWAISLQTYKNGLKRCRAVAGIVDIDTKERVGTGFLLPGKTLHHSLGDELYLLTNAHVISDDPEVHADPALDSPPLWSPQAVISFEELDVETGTSSTYTVANLIWSSPPNQLDVTLVKLDKPVKGIEPYPIAKYPPVVDGKQSVYVIGHPKGGGLSFSLQDSLLLDHQLPKLHYRTPTEQGNSGSPVFNREWVLLGLHHAGDNEMEKLNGKPGTYQANEGIWIKSIIDAVGKDLSEKSG